MMIVDMHALHCIYRLTDDLMISHYDPLTLIYILAELVVNRDSRKTPEIDSTRIRNKTVSIVKRVE